MKRITIVTSLLVCASVVCRGQQVRLSGGGDLNPDLKTSEKALKQWQDMRVGMCVHWGPSSLGGREIGWSRGTSIPAERYDNFYKDFNPDKFDADQWCDLLKRWGMRYLSITTKHHDGFSIWFSDYTDYDMENAAGKVDIMAELKEACDRHGIVLGAYYSILDWYHPDWAPYEHGGPGPMFEKQSDSPDTERYFRYMENQVKELIRKYDLAFIQFDGEWKNTYTHRIGSRMYRSFHELKPDILLNTRVDIGRRASGKQTEIDGSTYAGDFHDRERMTGRGGNVSQWGDYPWQAWVTLDKSQWSYNKTPRLMTADELIKDMVNIVGNNGNYMINLGPQPDGRFAPEQMALMDTLGMWLDRHAETIYGTRGGPYHSFEGGVCTHKGKKAWIFVTDDGIDTLRLPASGQKIRSAKVYGTGQRVEMEQTDEYTRLSVPAGGVSAPVRVIELRFADDIRMPESR